MRRDFSKARLAFASALLVPSIAMAQGRPSYSFNLIPDLFVQTKTGDAALDTAMVHCANHMFASSFSAPISDRAMLASASFDYGWQFCHKIEEKWVNTKMSVGGILAEEAQERSQAEAYAATLK